MSDDCPSVSTQIAAELDAVLMKQNEVEAKARKTRNELREWENAVSALSGEAQRIRLAMFALEGQSLDTTSAGEANKANLERKQELSRHD